MKRYSVIDKQTGEEVAGPWWHLGIAHRVAKALGAAFDTVTWIGFFGLPAGSCVFRDDGQLECICLYRKEAERIAAHKNEHEPGSFKVQNVMINTAYGDT